MGERKKGSGLTLTLINSSGEDGEEKEKKIPFTRYRIHLKKEMKGEDHAMPCTERQRGKTREEGGSRRKKEKKKKKRKRKEIKTK